MTLKVGDWVYYNDDDSWLDGALGYIDGICDSNCLVLFVQDCDGHIIRVRRVISAERLIPASMMRSLTDDAFKYLMDLALATKDFEWCRQLTEQYNRVKKASVESCAR